METKPSFQTVIEIADAFKKSDPTLSNYEALDLAIKLHASQVNSEKMDALITTILNKQLNF